MKKTVMAAVSALLATIALSAQPSKTPSHESPHGQNRYLAAVYANGPNERGDGEADQTEPGSDAPKWYATFEEPDGMLVIVGLITCVVIGWQSVETRKAASAAFAQIQMTKAKERARLEIKGSSLGV